MPLRILLTGATGFVGQGVLERLIAQRPECSIDILMRSGSADSARARLGDLFSRGAFGPWRARVGDAAAVEAIADRVTVLRGALADLGPLIEHRPPYDLVVHCAGDVSFDGPIDAAFASNVGGAVSLYEALRDTGTTPHVVHVSTAYVWTDRVKLGLEEPVPHEVSWRREQLSALAQRARREAEWHADVASTELAGRAPSTPAQAARRRGRWVDAQLAADGHDRARLLGWTDVYTLTKALGERVAEEFWADGPLTILRPTIIESALERPYEGWIDGFKVADPLFAAYAKGRLPGVPGIPDAVVDVVPVDFVVNAILAAAATPPPPRQTRYLHVGTSTTNPITMDEIRRHVQGFFAERPWVDSGGEEVRPRPWKFTPPGELVDTLSRRERALEALARVTRRAPGRRGRALRRTIGDATRRLSVTRQYVKLYEPYTSSRTCFDDRAARILARRPYAHVPMASGRPLAAASDTTARDTTARDKIAPGTSAPGTAARDAAGRDTAGPDTGPWDFDATRIHWGEYWTRVHLPALVDLMLATGGRAQECRRRSPAPLDSDLGGVRVVERSVEAVAAGLAAAGLTLLADPLRQTPGRTAPGAP